MSLQHSHKISLIKFKTRINGQMKKLNSLIKHQQKTIDKKHLLNVLTVIENFLNRLLRNMKKTVS